MLDRFHRAITYLRVSVTDRCNLRCIYCMPEEGIEKLPSEAILSFEEIERVVRVAVGRGVNKVRLTGGEPLVRRGIVTLVAMLARIPGVRDLAMTTNGILLSEYAEALTRAGLHRVNVSLDSVDPLRYAEITRGGDVRCVLAGIDAARKTGLEPVKLNCVVEESPDEKDALGVAEFAKLHALEVRFIRRMDLTRGRFSAVHGGSGGDCRHCNRLRLSSDGFVRPCLFSDLEFNVRELGAEEALRRAVAAKPERGLCSQKNRFYAIGG